MTTMTTSQTIQRDNLLDTLDKMSQTPADAVLLQGEPGIGKTTLLHQFAARHQSNTIALFIRPVSRVACDTQYLFTQLYEQAAILAHQDPHPSTELVDTGVLHATLRLLHRRMQRRNQVCYFIIDGIDEMPPEDAGSRTMLLDALPFGLPLFRFLITSDNLRRTELSTREFHLVAFTPDDTHRYLSDCVPSRSQSDEVHRTCRGIPGHLAAVRRVLQSGVTIDALLKDFPLTVPGLFDIEWKAIGAERSAIRDALAIVAFSRNEHSVEELGQILSTPSDTLRTKMQELSFIALSHDTPAYLSESFRKFAREKLQSEQRRATELVLDYLLRTPASDDALSSIPTHLEQLERYDELLKYLSPSHFTEVLARSNSLQAVSKKAALGMRAASRIKRDGDLARFAIQLSTASSIARSSAWTSEIEARMRLQDVEGAKRIAQNALAKEVRLQLLAAIARTMREARKPIDPDILDDIDQLYKDVDLSSLGDRVSSLAADLLYVRPELASRILDESPEYQKPNNRGTVVLATISAMSRERDDNSTEFKVASAALRDRITDPKTQQLTHAASLLYAEYDPAEMVAEVESIKNRRVRISLLGYWLKRNAERPDAYIVLEYALNNAIAATELSPSATVFLELCAPLPYMPDTDRRRTFVGIVDSHRAAAERLGPTADYVGLCLRIARSETTYNTDSARQRLQDTFQYTLGIADPVTRATCLARVVNALDVIDPEHTLEVTTHTHSTTRVQLSLLVDQILTCTAEHSIAMKGILDALSRTRNELALDIASRLNTQERRDQAHHALVRGACSGASTDAAFLYAIDASARIASQEVRDRAIAAIFTSAFQEKEPSMLSDATSRRIGSMIEQIASLNYRCRAACSLYGHLRLTNSESAPDLLARIRQWWVDIESGWERVDVGFRISKRLADVDATAALGFLTSADSYRREAGISSDATSSVMFLSMKLAVRAYSGLLPRKMDTDGDLERLTQLIARVPSQVQQIAIWSDIAFRMFLAARSDDCRTLVSRHIIPAMNVLWSQSRRDAEHALTGCITSLFVSHRDLAEDWLNKVSLPIRDSACVMLFKGMIRKRDPEDAYDSSSKSQIELKHEHVLELIGIIRHMHVDDSIYWAIRQLASGLSSKRSRVSKSQMIDIATRLCALVKGKLPDANNIQHDGYKIVCLGEIARIADTDTAHLTTLVDGARAILNVADRAFVLSCLICSHPRLSNRERRELIDEVSMIIPSIPSALERCGRYRTLCRAALDGGEPSAARNVIQKAMMTSFDSDEDDIRQERRRIVDEAYRMDPKLAAALVERGDSDPARIRAREELKDEYEQLERKSSRARQDGSIVSGNLWDDEIGAQAWQLLGSMNAGRAPLLTKERARDWIAAGSKADITASYPTFALAIESVICRYAKMPDADVALRQLFDGIMLSLELAFRVCMSSSRWIPAMAPSLTDRVSSVLVRCGERELAIDFIREFLSNCSGDTLSICDPYFTPEDLSLLRIVLESAPHLSVRILTSQKCQESSRVAQPFDESYRAHWRKSVMDEDPPQTEIMIAGVAPDGSLPIHDRWWLLGDTGLRSGTSFNGLGVRESELSMLTHQESVARVQDVERFLVHRVKQHDGKRISYTMFTL